MGRVSGKVALVTGAARGIGAASAKRLIEEGAQVMLTDITDDLGEKAAHELGSRARYLHHDVTNESEWKQVVLDTEATLGPISVLVNNAGVLPLIGPIETLELSDYRRVIEINQVSTFLGMKSVLPSMKRAGGGSIINISSLAGLVGNPFTYAYTASKFAVRGMTKCAAIEFAPFEIRVNSIHPGLIRTQMTVGTANSEETVAIAAAATPARRMGEAEEVANIVLLLASDEARYSTGAEFVIDGGHSCQ